MSDVASEQVCDVCADEPIAGVAAVPGVPWSVAYGARCLKANAHPWWILVANTAMVGGYEHSAEWWRQMVDDTLAHLGKTLGEFKDAVAVAAREQDEALGE